MTCDGAGSLSCLSCFPHKCSTSICPPAFKPLHEITSCRSRCSSGRYQHGDICLPCNPACRECKGPLASECIDPTPQALFTSADCGDGASRKHGLCELDCPEYMFLDMSGRCSPCDLTCARCTGPSPGECLKCHPLLADSAALYNGVCVRRQQGLPSQIRQPTPPFSCRRERLPSQMNPPSLLLTPYSLLAAVRRACFATWIALAGSVPTSVPGVSCGAM